MPTLIKNSVFLTKNFTLHEFTKSPQAIRLGIDNTPNPQQISNLTLLCQNILQPVRDHFDKAVTVNSGYRCKQLNDATPGSSKTSQHTKGEAADIEIVGVSNYDLATWILNNTMFDQTILEYHNHNSPNSGWVHVSYSRTHNRRQVLSKLLGNKKYLTGLIVD